jgi:hypothetical protein
VNFGNMQIGTPIDFSFWFPCYADGGISGDLMNTGAAATADVLNAQQTLVNARQSLIVAQHNRIVASYGLSPPLAGFLHEQLFLPESRRQPCRAE